MTNYLFALNRLPRCNSSPKFLQRDSFSESYEHTHQFDIKRVAFDLIRKELAYHVGGDNHNSFALESCEWFHLSTARSWVNVGLVQNVVPGRFQFGQSGNGGCERQSWTFG